MELFDALMAQEDQSHDPKKREYATVTKPDGTIETLWGDAHSAPIPEGNLLSVSHNHPGGSSLSLGDLLLLERVGQMEAVGNKTYVARKGAKYGDLQKAYDDLATRISGELEKQKSIRGYNTGPSREERINAELAKLGIIEYEEKPARKKK